MIVLAVYISVLFICWSVGIFTNKKLDMLWMDKNHTTVYKGIAIVIIMLSHMAGDYTNLRFFTPLGGIGVSMFLVTSGYGLVKSHHKNGVSHFWAKRLKAVWIPYFLCETVAAVIFHSQTIVPYILDILIIYPQYAYGWYLQYILLCYFSFWVVYKFIPELYRIKVLCIISVLIFIFLPEIMAEQSFSFLAGVCLAEYSGYEKADKKKRILGAWGLLMLGGLFLVIKQLPEIRSSSEFVMKFVQLGIKLPCGLFLLVFIYRVRILFYNKIWLYIGTISYEIYLVHGYIMTLFTENTLGNGIVIVFLIMIISIAFYYMNLLIQKALKIKVR